LFSLRDCKFSIEKCKEATGRVVVFKELNIVNSFTLECSFFGKENVPEKGAAKKKLTHMSI
jgi:hypothetical protein